MKINEISTPSLDKYTKAADADYAKASAEGDYKKAYKRSSGMMKAAGKKIDNDVKASRKARGVAEGSEIKIPTEDGIGWQDIRLLAGEGKLTQKTIKQAIEIIRKHRKKEQGVAEEISRRGLLKGLAGAAGGLGVVGVANQLGKTRNLDAENVTTVNGEKYTLGRPSLGAKLDGKTSVGKYKLVKDDKGNIVYIWNDVRTVGGPTRFVRKFIPVDQLQEQGVSEGFDNNKVEFEVDSENAYNHIMKKFGSVIDWDGDTMVAPRKYWGSIQELAYAAGGEATEVGDEQGVAEAKDPSAKIAALEKKIDAKQGSLEMAREKRRMSGKSKGVQGEREIKLAAEISKLRQELHMLKQGVSEGVTPASTSKVLRLIDRHHPEWFDTYGMGEVEDTVVDLADMGQFSGMSATDALELVGQELESLYGQQGVAEAGNKPLEPHFGMGDSSTPRELKTQMRGASDEFVRSTAGKKTGPFHSKVAKMQGKLAKSELRRREQGLAEVSEDTVYPNAEVIKSKNGRAVGEIYQDSDGTWGAFHYRADRGADGMDSREDAVEELRFIHSETGRSRPDYTIKGVAEGAPIVVMPRADRLKKPEPTKVRYQGDIVPPTQPPSTEKRGVKGRPGQRPMPKYEEQGVAEGLSAEEYKQKLLATLPDIMRFYEKNVKGWKPSKEQMLAAVETGYTVMKHTGDVKQAGKAVIDELNTLHRMSQGQSVAEGLGKTIKRSLAGWGAFDKDKPADVVKRVKGQDTDTLKTLSRTGSTGKGSPAELQQKAISRELKKRSQQGVAESLKPGEYHVHTVQFTDGTSTKIQVKSDEITLPEIKKFFAKKGKAVVNVDWDWAVRGEPITLD